MIARHISIGKKAMLFAASLSLYTFVLMFIFRAVDLGHFPLMPTAELPSSTALDASNKTFSQNFSTRSPPESSVPQPSQTWSSSSFHNVRGPISFRLNANHIPRNNISWSKSDRRYNDPSTYFRERLKGKFLDLLLETVRAFDVTLTRVGVDYMMYGGTLIGSYRHHGLVPWDDDIDFILPLSAKRSVYRALSSTRPKYIVNTDRSYSWKMFSADAVPIRGYNWKWPYLDIFFYAENETHIWDYTPHYSSTFVYPKNIIFPMRRRPFMGLFLPAPFNSRAVIDTNYDINLCKSGFWIHKWERGGIETAIPCYILYSKFPFVSRTFQNRGCSETLIRDRKTISSYFDKNGRC